MARARIPSDAGRAAVRDAVRGATQAPDRETTARAVRYLLQRLADTAPGNSVEVRVPPFGAVQCVTGPRHTRGTPPNVIEMTSEVWLELATGTRDWASAISGGMVAASGSRASLEGLLPLDWDTAE